MILVAVTLVAATAMASCSCSGKYSSETIVISDYSGAQNYRDVKSGDRVERDMKVDSFTSVNQSVAMTITYVQAPQCRLVLAGDAKEVDRYQAEVKKGVLSIKAKKDRNIVKGRTPEVKAYLYAPSLEHIVLSGAGDLCMPEAVTLDQSLSIMLSGAGDLEVKNLKVKGLSVTLSGAGDLNIDHLTASEDVYMTVSGAGDMEGNIKARDIHATVSGAGDMDITVDCRLLEAVVSGMGDMKVKGKCQSSRTVTAPMASMNMSKLKVLKK